ncbi:MAG: hypothetical protein J7K31_04495 [Candidatus Aenigmarchaeota archaeon]|nr:hypothetical protein [Candidatus Aenigmarchaeota archaeon]
MAEDKGLELTTMAFIIIALFAVLMVISFFSKSLPQMNTNVYCQLYQAVNAISFATDKPPLPPQCSIEPRPERRTVGRVEAKDFYDDMADYVFGCWRKSQQGTVGFTFICFELYFDGVDGVITEKNVTDKMMEKNYCRLLPNNFLDLLNETYYYDGVSCGNITNPKDNIVEWESDITGEGLFIVKYDAFKRKIIVK